MNVFMPFFIGGLRERGASFYVSLSLHNMAKMEQRMAQLETKMELEREVVAKRLKEADAGANVSE